MQQENHNTVSVRPRLFLYGDDIYFSFYGHRFLFVNNVTEVIRNYNDTLFKGFVLYQVQLSPVGTVYLNADARIVSNNSITT